jgi:hypothetical protein
MRGARSNSTNALVGAIRFVSIILFVLVLTSAAVLFFPPLRDRVFAMSLWPWKLPGEVTAAELEALQQLARPGDVIVESNMHYGQWVHLITMEGKVVVLPISIYGKWHSTRLALIHPPYSKPEQAQEAISHAQIYKNTVYDPWFENPDASCTGVVGEAISHAGLSVPYKLILGRRIYGADSFFKIPGARILWSTDRPSIEHGSV